MDKEFVMREGENGFERALGILEMIGNLSDNVSQEEIDGAADFVYPELRNTVLGALELESSRGANVLLFQHLLTIFHEAQDAHAEGKKLLYYPFTFPPEIFWGFETIQPLCTEIVGGLAVNICAGQGERFWDYAMGMGLPDSLCSGPTIPVASMCMGPGLKPDAIAYNTVGSCNPNAVINAFASEYLGIPQFLLEKPVDETRRGRDLQYQYLSRFIAELEEWSGEELKVERLRDVLEKSNKMVELYYELWEMKKAKPCPVPNMFSVIFLATLCVLWGREEGVEIMQKMVDISKERLRKGLYTAPEEVARVYLAYIPFLFDFDGFFNWMEKKGVSILGNTMSIHFFPEVDFSSKESMIRALSERAFDYPMNRQLGGNSISMRWFEDVKHAVEDLGAEACVYCGHHACKHTNGTIAYFRREMMKQLSVPTLCMVGDAFDKRHLTTSMYQEEIERFVEQLISKKKAPKRRKRPAKKAVVNPEIN